MKLSEKLRTELIRMLSKHRYEVDENGLLVFPGAKLSVGGFFTLDHWRNGELLASENLHNLVVLEGRNDLLSTYLKNGAQIPSWYVALFAGNITPSDALTAANFPSSATEFTNYVESTRQAWVGGSVSNAAVDNNASKAAFTVDVGGGTVYGAALVSASAKSATTGKLFAATRFSASRAVLQYDVLNVGYSVTATST